LALIPPSGAESGCSQKIYLGRERQTWEDRERVKRTRPCKQKDGERGKRGEALRVDLHERTRREFNVGGGGLGLGVVKGTRP